MNAAKQPPRKKTADTSSEINKIFSEKMKVFKFSIISQLLTGYIYLNLILDIIEKFSILKENDIGEITGDKAATGRHRVGRICRIGFCSCKEFSLTELRNRSSVDSLLWTEIKFHIVIS